MTQVVGRSTPRVEGVLKVTGKAQYSADLNLPETLWGRCLRSPMPYGADQAHRHQQGCAGAGRKGGAHRSWTCRGCASAAASTTRRCWPTAWCASSARKSPRWRRTTKQAAEAALELIEVEYEEMEPLLDPVEAVKDGSTVLHPDLLSYKGLPVPVEKVGNVFRLPQVGQGRHRSRFQAGRSDRRKYFHHPSDASVLFGAARLRRQHARRRQRRYLVVQQDAVRGARPAVQLHRRGQRKIGFSSDAYRRRLRRQGRLHGRGGGLLSVEEGRHAGENGDGLHRGIDRRQSAPRVDHQSQNRREKRTAPSSRIISTFSSTAAPTRR